MVALHLHHLPTRFPALSRLADALWYALQAHHRPRTRADCINATRPCPWVSCEYHRIISVSQVGTLYAVGMYRGLPQIAQDDTWIERAARIVSETDASCVLDLADENGIDQEMVAGLIDRSLDRTRVIERTARDKVKSQCIELDITPPWSDAPEMTYPEGDEDDD